MGREPGGQWLSPRVCGVSELNVAAQLLAIPRPVWVKRLERAPYRRGVA